MLKPYPQFMVYDFEAILAPFNEQLIDSLTSLSRDVPVSIVIHYTLGRESMYLVKEKLECLTE